MTLIRIIILICWGVYAPVSWGINLQCQRALVSKMQKTEDQGLILKITPESKIKESVAQVIAHLSSSPNSPGSSSANFPVSFNSPSSAETDGDASVDLEMDLPFEQSNLSPISTQDHSAKALKESFSVPTQTVPTQTLQLQFRGLNIVDLGYTPDLLINQLTLELAAKGWRLFPAPKKGPFRNFNFLGLWGPAKTRNFLITKDLPDYVKAQASLMLSFLNDEICCHHSNASNRENYAYSNNPKFTRLTAANVHKIKEGVYSYVFIYKEPFLRLGQGHHIIGERLPVYAAGDISIRKNKQTQLNEIEYINSRSDTYRPMTIDCIAALIAMWRQDLFPREIKILNWDNSPSKIDFNEAIQIQPMNE